MEKIKSVTKGLSMALFAFALVVSAHAAHAQFDDYGDNSGCDCGDYGSVDYTSSDYGSVDYTPANYGSVDYTPANYGSVDYTPSYSGGSNSTPSYYGSSNGGSYSTPSYYGGSSNYTSPSYYTSTPSYTNTTSKSSTYAPSTSSTYAPYTSSTFAPYTSTVKDNGNTYSTVHDNGNTYAPNQNNGNTVDSYNSCVQPGSCSTTVTTSDSHNTTISTPTTINNVVPQASNTQIVYNNPAPQPINYTYTSPTPTPYIAAPTCVITATRVAYGQGMTLNWSSTNAVSGWINTIGNVSANGSTVINAVQGGSYQATFTGQNGQTVSCSTIASAQTVVTTTHQAVPYVTLSEVPYTGLDLGPFGVVMYWSFLALASLAMAYLIVVKKAHLALASNLKSVLFGDEDSKEVADNASSDESEVAPVAHFAPVQSHDAIDSFVMGQIQRA